jgi:hypothetical protein
MDLNDLFKRRSITGFELPDQAVFIVGAHDGHIKITNEKEFCSIESKEIETDVFDCKGNNGRTIQKS